MRRSFFALLMAVIWLLAPTLPVAGASITVDASCSLADAITAANTDTATGSCIAGTAGSDTITITAAGTTDGTITLSAELAVNGTSTQDSVIVLVGGDFTVSGDDSVRVFKVQQYGNLSISNLTITNGSAANGGGVHVDSGGILTLNNVVIKDSEATDTTGGGLRNLGTLTMSNSEVHNNSSTTHGGGLDLRGTVNITSSIIRNNSTVAGRYGGGVYVTGNPQNISIQTSSIHSNSTGNGFGGGIFVNSASPFVVKNSTIYSNRATSGGGGFYNNAGQTNFIHVTVAFNLSNAGGAGVQRNTGTLRLRNSIVAGNTRGDGVTRRNDCHGTVGEMTNTLVQDGRCSATFSGDPMLASAVAGSPPYYALQDSSPAIGVGNDTYCAEVGTDQRGETRPATGCDIGAYENPASMPTVTPTPTVAPTPTVTPTPTPEDGASITVDASCSLPDAITAANTNTATGGCIAGTTGDDMITITEPGTSGGTITLSAELAVNGTSELDSVIILIGGGFTVSGNDSVRVFKVQQYGNLSISNLTITNGSADNGGGVKVDSGGILTLNNVVIKDSEATTGTGGGLRNEGTLTMSNSEVHSNSSTTNGGGLDLRATVNITSSIIRNNSTTAGRYGGGVFVTGNSENISIQTSSIYSNSTGNGFGGGIFVSSARPFVVKNSTIYNNRATSGGGGLYHNGGQTNFIHVTVAFNLSNSGGAGVQRNTGTLRLRNSIVAGNTRGDGVTRRNDCHGTVGEMTNTLVQDGRCSATFSGDPMLASAVAGSPPYYALQDSSPAIGVGNDTYCASVGTDQRGETRPATACDIGAYENPALMPTVTPTPTATNTPLPTATHTPGPSPTNTLTPTPEVGALITVDASCNLPDAITAANTNTATGGCIAGTTGDDVITITEAGTSGGTITLSAELAVNGTSELDSVIILLGNGFAVSGDKSVRVFHVEEYGDLRISNLTITEGSGDDGGGVLVDSGGILSLTSVVISQSEATTGTGGGLRNNGTLTMTNSVVHSNVAATSGGGLDLRGTVSISSSVIRDNAADDNEFGGGIYVAGHSRNIVIQTSSIYSNSVENGFGGGIYVNAANLFVLKNSTLFDNLAGGGGGGFYHNFGTSELTHVTLAFNRTSISGGGISRNTGQVRLRNSIVSGSTSPLGLTERTDCEGSITDVTNTLIEESATCTKTYTRDPKLASAPEGSPPYYALLDDSPAIGAGDDTYCAEIGTDQRGESRPETGCDIGAFESPLSAARPPDTPTPALQSQRIAAVSANSRARAPRSPSATPTTGPSTGELLVNQGYQLSATYGLNSGAQFQRVSASGIGIQSVLDMGFLDAIDVWGYVAQGVEVCFPQHGTIVFLDASTSPRTVTTIPFWQENGFTCANLTSAGTVVLVMDGPATPTVINAPVVLSGCTIQTTDLVNMRNAPYGDQVLMVFLPGTVFAALQRTTGWFQVNFNGTLGWISADYVLTAGDCG